MSEPMSPAPPPPGGMSPYQPPPGPSRPGLPWERGKDFNSLLETVKMLVTSPGRAYSEAKEKGDYGSPLIFAVIMWIVGGIFSAIWALLRFGGGMGMLSNMGDMPPEAQEMLRTIAAPAGAGSIVLGIILAPIFGLVGLFIWSAIVHLVMKLIGGLNDSTAGFEGTVRALSYSAVSNLAQIIPFAGGLAAGVWGLVLQVIGLADLHRTSQGKAVAGVLIPLALCCICIAIAFFAFMGAIMAAIGAAAGGAGL